jgi:hypothetical protein
VTAFGLRLAGCVAVGFAFIGGCNQSDTVDLPQLAKRALDRPVAELSPEDLWATSGELSSDLAETASQFARSHMAEESRRAALRRDTADSMAFAESQDEFLLESSAASETFQAIDAIASPELGPNGIQALSEQISEITNASLQIAAVIIGVAEAREAIDVLTVLRDALNAKPDAALATVLSARSSETEAIDQAVTILRQSVGAMNEGLSLAHHLEGEHHKHRAVDSMLRHSGSVNFAGLPEPPRQTPANPDSDLYAGLRGIEYAPGGLDQWPTTSAVFAELDRAREPDAEAWARSVLEALRENAQVLAGPIAELQREYIRAQNEYNAAIAGMNQTRSNFQTSISAARSRGNYSGASQLESQMPRALGQFQQSANIWQAHAMRYQSQMNELKSAQTELFSALNRYSGAFADYRRAAVAGTRPFRGNAAYQAMKRAGAFQPGRAEQAGRAFDSVRRSAPVDVLTSQPSPVGFGDPLGRDRVGTVEMNVVRVALSANAPEAENAGVLEAGDYQGLIADAIQQGMVLEARAVVDVARAAYPANRELAILDIAVRVAEQRFDSASELLSRQLLDHPDDQRLHRALMTLLLRIGFAPELPDDLVFVAEAQEITGGVVPKIIALFERKTTTSQLGAIGLRIAEVGGYGRGYVDYAEPEVVPTNLDDAVRREFEDLNAEPLALIRHLESQDLAAMLEPWGELVGSGIEFQRAGASIARHLPLGEPFVMLAPIELAELDQSMVTRASEAIENGSFPSDFKMMWSTEWIMQVDPESDAVLREGVWRASANAPATLASSIDSMRWASFDRVTASVPIRIVDDVRDPNMLVRGTADWRGMLLQATAANPRSLAIWRIAFGSQPYCDWLPWRAEEHNDSVTNNTMLLWALRLGVVDESVIPIAVAAALSHERLFGVAEREDWIKKDLWPSIEKSVLRERKNR